MLQALVVAVVVSGPITALGAENAPASAAEGSQPDAAALDELVAPIALYPDELLAITLPASTFPLQIVQASRFLEKRKSDPKLEPNEAWDESVIGLLNYPDVVEMMNEDLDWTWKLGEAVVNDQPAVMDAVQRFRARVDAAGNLESNDKVVVEKKSEGTQQVIVIQSASPDVIYVPTYQPSVVVVRYAVPYYYYYSVPYPYYYSRTAVFWTGMYVGTATVYGVGWGYGHHHSSITVNHNYNVNVNHSGSVQRPSGGGEVWRPPSDRPHGGRPSQQPLPGSGTRPSGPTTRPATPGTRPSAPTTRPATPGTRPSAPTTRPAPGGSTRPGAEMGQTPSASQRDRAGAGAYGGSTARPTSSGRDYTRGSRDAGGMRDSSIGSYERGSAARTQGARGASSRGGGSMGRGSMGGGRGGGGRGGGGGRR
jgi:uncharacterized membrane protein YgcG